MPYDRWFPDSKRTAEYLLGKVKDNDIILIKGSRAVGMEKIVQRLRRS
jgi:UDP-N-acetylmuramyl pentapeptide synthase